MTMTWASVTRAAALSLGIVTSTVSAAAAQTGPTPAEMKALTGAVGQTVRLTTVDGKDSKGHLTFASQGAIALDGKPVSLEQVSRVKTAPHWGPKATVIGLGAGLGTAVVTGVLCGDDGCEPAAIAGGALGFAAGFGLTALLSNHGDVLYNAQKRTTSIAIAPIVSPTRKGVAFRMSWR